MKFFRMELVNVNDEKSEFDYDSRGMTAEKMWTEIRFAIELPYVKEIKFLSRTTENDNDGNLISEKLVVLYEWAREEPETPVQPSPENQGLVWKFGR